MRLIATTPTVRVEEVLAEMAFEPLMAATVEEMAPPTPDELVWLRERIDPDHLVIGKGKRFESERYRRLFPSASCTSKLTVRSRTL